MPAQAQSNADTRELDHLLAMHFGWWDVLVSGRRPVQPAAALDLQPRSLNPSEQAPAGLAFLDAHDD